MKWTKEMSDMAAALWRDGKSARQIAEAMSQVFGLVSRNAVIGRIHRMGLARIGGAPRPRERPSRAKPKPKPSMPAVSLGAGDDESAHREPPLPRARSDGPPARQRPESAPPPARPLTTMELPFAMTACRCPVGGQGAGTLYCGARTLKGLPYCEAHARLAYQALKVDEEDAA